MIINELRVGNWVLLDNKDYNVIGSISPRSVRFKPYTMLFRIERCYPIPLTPEILEKCGLNKDIFDKYYEITDDIYFSNGHVSYRYWEGDSSRGGLEFQNIAKIDFLHQLQNLYFALTGEELTVNL